MKIKEKAEVDGSPPTTPPTVLPALSAITVIRGTHKLPMANARARCNNKESEIMPQPFGL
jgi:hypothetical protein